MFFAASDTTTGDWAAYALMFGSFSTIIIAWINRSANNRIEEFRKTVGKSNGQGNIVEMLENLPNAHVRTQEMLTEFMLQSTREHSEMRRTVSTLTEVVQNHTHEKKD
jgi:hypothetical protein